MAKKRAKKKTSSIKGLVHDDRQPRKEPYNAERMNQHVARLKEQAARIAGLAKALEDSEIDSIVVDGHAMLLRGLNQIDNFADNASRAVREARTAMLDT